MTETRQLLSQAEFAKYLSEKEGRKINRQTVNYYKSKGYLVMIQGVRVNSVGDSNYQIGSLVSQKEFEKEIRRLKESNHKLPEGITLPLVDILKSVERLTKCKGQSVASKETKTSHSNTSDSKGSQYDYQHERSVEKHFQAQIKRMEAEELAGKLVSLKEVQEEAFASAKQFRDSFLQLPQKLAGALAVLNDPRKIKAVLIEEIDNCLMGIVEILDKNKELIDHETVESLPDKEVFS